MDNEKIDAILRKVKGLLAIAEDNANDEEAQSAFVRAQILMMKYNIDQREVENRLEEDASTIEDFGTVYKTLYWFERALAIVIAKNFRVKNF
ncbi:DUF2786 domain-containing protein [Metasolibacillus sp.]|uniref:DUF2786 domain-containing protein n=1 Tax=Metasolibacillus sp. TaxID=2703680 RepID=UPI0025EAA10B|nr:DUF2786 domain-containing protein [Metasolibacillus sp.]MCT6922787.1 DUF2786 domain-containing protein [Metasolibacillus sp.]MCT6938874.1 DUF2786 domain-containing protein [Metasolibacillus sp.]